MKLTDQEQVILKAIEHVAGSRNGLASVPAVTRAVGFPISTTQKILAALHRKEIIALHHHDYPAQMTADEKKRAVKIGNDYFHAVAIRNPIRFEAGKRLTKAEKEEVLRTMGDSYKELRAPRVIKGKDRNDDLIYGCAYDPEYMYTSDITGRKIRHYIRLADDRRAHPTELFSNLTKAEIDKYATQKEYEEGLKNDRNRSRAARIASEAKQGGTLKGEANERYKATGRKIEGSYFAQDSGGRLVRVDGNDPADWIYYEAQGFRRMNPATGSNMKRGAAKKNPSPAQLKARAKFAKMAKKRAAEAKKANPRARNKAATVSAADIAKMPAHVQAKLRGDLAKVEAKEAKATTPTQKAAAVKARRSFLSRLGTRLRVIGQTKKYKVSARNLNKAPRKTIKIRARHETDAIAKAQAKLGGGFDQFKVQNTVRHRVGNPTFTITATEKGVHLGSFQDKTKTAALKRAKQAYGHRYAGIKATANNPKRRNGIAKTAGKAIKKVTRAVLGGVSKVAGKGAQALKNPAKPNEWEKAWGAYVKALADLDKPLKGANAKLAYARLQKAEKKIAQLDPGFYKRVIQKRNPSRRRNLDHRDSSHQVKVHQHWRAGGLSQWQRAHHAGQHDLFSHGIKAKAKRNPDRRHLQAEAIEYALKGRTLTDMKSDFEYANFSPKEYAIARKYFLQFRGKSPEQIQALMSGAASKARAGFDAKKKRRRKTVKKNPSASAIRKKFAGRVSGSRELYFPKGAPQGMAKLGRLVSIKLKGGKLIKPSRRNPSAEIWLCSDTSGKLWLGCTKAGPLYAGAPGDLGEMSVLEYAESKPHLGYANNTIWFHKMGEVSGRRPHLIVNDDQDLLIKGGNYKITRAGIVD